jgi:hypothetical protein
VLNEICHIVLPQNCQILHPFKIIVDNLDRVQEYAKTLCDNLTKAKRIFESKMNHPNSTLNRMSGHLSTIGIDGNHSTNDHDGSTNEAAKPKEEEDLEVAQEKVVHYGYFIQLLQKHLAHEIEVDKAIKAVTAEKIMFCHLWHLSYREKQSTIRMRTGTSLHRHPKS